MNILAENEREYLESLGFIYIQHGKFGVAEVILSALNKCFENDFHILRSLAYVKLMQGEKNEALAHIKNALGIFPGDSVAILMEGMCSGEGIEPSSFLKLQKDIYDQG